MKIKLENVTKRFGDFTAVNDFSLDFNEGELICLLGPSGCGKSTLLNMLSGILPVTKGKIYFDDKDVTNMAPQYRGVGLVFQNYALYPHMSVLENICFPLEIKKVAKAERIAKAKEMAKLVKIEEYLDRKPAQLSGGQQQRVAIARALIKQPKLLLLDEPLSNLDARLRLEMREEIRRIQKETKVTTIFVTHDQEEAMSICDRIVLMKDGLLIQEDKPQALYDEPKKLFVSTFLGTPPINCLKGSAKDGYFVLQDGSKIRLNDNNAKVNCEKAILGIRAESLIPSETNYHFEATLLERFVMGKEELVLLQIGNDKIRSFIDSEQTAQVGDKVKVRLKEKGVFVFDEESGQRL